MDDNPRRPRDLRVVSGRSVLIAAAVAAVLFAGVLAATGGASSPWMVLVFVFCVATAYFGSRRDTIVAVTLFCVALFSPLAYESGSERSDAIPSLLVTVGVLILISGAISAATARLSAARSQVRSDRTGDELTGLVNSHGLRARIQDEIKGGVSRGMVDELGAPIVGGLVVVDLDDFKSVNRDHGPAEGDLLLQEVAEALVDAARSGDTVARLEGDVFAIFAPDTTESGVKALAERSVRAVSAASVDVGLGKANVTASVGYAVYPTHAGTSDSLIAAADGAMHRAKREGKNLAASARSLNSL